MAASGGTKNEIKMWLETHDGNKVHNASPLIQIVAVSLF